MPRATTFFRLSTVLATRPVEICEVRYGTPRAFRIVDSPVTVSIRPR